MFTPIKEYFSPYSNVELKNNLVFSASQVLNFLPDKKVYTWGIYDGSGLPINLTPENIIINLSMMLISSMPQKLVTTELLARARQ